MSTTWVIVGIFVITYLVYNLLQYILLPKPANRIGLEQIDISQSTQVISSEELKKAWTSTSGSTLLFYINPMIKDRTSHSGNEYASILKIGTKQSLKLLVAPDAGRGQSLAPAVFEVFVKGSAVPDRFDIPNMSLQKWSSIAIVKNGRKFNIFVNGRLVATHMCTAMPDFDETQPLRIGDSRMGGKIALMSLASYPMEADEVRSFLAANLNADGKPYLSSDLAFLPIPTFNLSFGCPGGNCTNATKPGPFEQWTSPYA
jgi:hypothetical protein